MTSCTYIAYKRLRKKIFKSWKKMDGTTHPLTWKGEKNSVQVFRGDGNHSSLFRSSLEMENTTLPLV